VLRLLLGAVYTGMGLAQLASFSQMPAILGAYCLVHGGAAALLAGAFIAGELLCGLSFLTRPGSRAAVPVWVWCTRRSRRRGRRWLCRLSRAA
jgi:hypothetical protein